MTALRLMSFAGLALLTAVPQAAAQQRLFAVMTDSAGSQWVARLWEGALADGPVVSVAHRASVPGIPIEVAVAAGGRFLVWQTVSPEGLAVFDRDAGRVARSAPLPLGLGVPDPAQPRLLAPYGGQIASVSMNGIATLPNTFGLSPRAITRDGRRLYTVRSGYAGFPFHDVVVVDSMTGQTLRTVRIPGESWTVPELVIADDESSIWLWTSVQAPPQTESTIRRLDMVSGVETLAIPLPGGSSTGLQVTTPHDLLFDEAGRRVAIALAHTRNGTLDRRTESGEIRVFDADTGGEIARTNVEGFSSLHFDRGTRSILAFSQSRIVELQGSTWCGPPVVRTLFVEPGRPPAVSQAAPGGRECYVVAFATPPPAPHLQQAEVSADWSVTLSWTGPPELATGFIVEAGNESGLANMASFPVASGPGLTVRNVPPGTYYVRVRSQNDIGLGAPSNEILVRVPSLNPSP